ncbi:serine hydrolase domain-containing protein [Sorangium sp. So ce513]|uniref:serine hydrolase domain-containing protein n=1 Tax=Sorangium sp. So ce513 TaxID=3133315 RepID=UPI003F6365CD
MSAPAPPAAPGASLLRRAARLSLLLALTRCATGERPPASPGGSAPGPEVAREAIPAARAPVDDAPLVVAEESRVWVDDPGRRAKLLAVAPQIEAHLGAELARQGIPGISFGVVVGGELAYARGFGARDPATPEAPDADTVYRVGSITKTLTAAAILQLRDEGKLALDDPAARYVPELAQVVYPTSDSPPIKIRHLLTHSSGLPRLGRFKYSDAAREVTEAELRAAVPGTLLEYVPGTKEVYSNFGFALLGLVVERASGRRYRDHVSERLLAPLGMSASFWDERAVPPGRLATGHRKRAGKLEPAAHWRFGASEAAGGLYSSLRDMARYVAFQLSAYPPRSGDDTGPLRRSSIREAHTTARPARLSVEPVAAEGRHAIDARATGYAYAWRAHQSCEDDAVVRHNGATDGYSAWVELYPRAGVGLVLLASSAEADAEALLDEVRATLREAGVTAPRKERPSRRLESAFHGAAALYERFDPARYEALFTPEFRGGVPDSTFEATVQRFRQTHGACRPGALLSWEPPLEARYAMVCERGRIEARLTLDAATSRIVRYHLDGIAPPTEAMKRAAERVIELAAGAGGAAGAAGDRTASLAQVLSRAADAGAVQQELRALEERHGRCKLGGSVDSDGDHEHAFRIVCERGGNRVMKLRLDPGEPDRVREIEIVAARQAGRCPERR